MARITRLLVISRGEIAVRTIRAAPELGITTIAAFSDADETSLAVELADESVNVGGAHARKSYLNQESLLGAAREVGPTPSIPATASCPRTPSSPGRWRQRA